MKQFIYKYGERGLFNNDNITAGSDYETDGPTLLQENQTPIEDVIMEPLPAEVLVLQSDRLYILKSELPRVQFMPLSK